jgi:hypothetical protein
VHYAFLFTESLYVCREPVHRIKMQQRPHWATALSAGYDDEYIAPTGLNYKTTNLSTNLPPLWGLPYHPWSQGEVINIGYMAEIVLLFFMVYKGL